MKEHLTSLYKFAFVKCGNRDLAEDLVQETCLKACESYLNKGEDEIKDFKAWLFKILINTHINNAIKLKKYNFVDIADFEFESNTSPTKNAEANIFFEDLNKVLRKLDYDQRVVIYLADINEYSYKEIANMLNLPIGTVKSRLHRARQAVREMLTSRGYSKELVKSGEKI